MTTSTITARVLTVSFAKGHHFSKTPALCIRLVAGLGVEGDAHMGETVKHLYLKRKNPDAPNLRQVHLIHAELFDEVAEQGFSVKPGDLGENITTSGIDLLGLSTGTRLYLGDDAIVEVTGLRNPCHQIEDFQKGLLAEVFAKDYETKTLVRKSGIMSIVISGGDIRPGDPIRVVPPDGPHQSLLLV